MQRFDAQYDYCCMQVCEGGETRDDVTDDSPTNDGGSRDDGDGCTGPVPSACTGDGDGDDGDDDTDDGGGNTDDGGDQGGNKTSSGSVESSGLLHRSGQEWKIKTLLGTVVFAVGTLLSFGVMTCLGFEDQLGPEGLVRSESLAASA